MAAVTALAQSSHQFGRALRQHNVAIEHDGVATKMDRFFLFDFDQLAYVFSNGALAVFVERRRKPNGRAIGQRTKTSIEMVKTRIDKFN